MFKGVVVGAAVGLATLAFGLAAVFLFGAAGEVLRGSPVDFASLLLFIGITEYFAVGAAAPGALLLAILLTAVLRWIARRTESLALVIGISIVFGGFLGALNLGLALTVLARSVAWIGEGWSVSPWLLLLAVAAGIGMGIGSALTIEAGRTR